MTFKALSLVIIIGCSSCLETPRAYAATAGPAAYTRITDTVDIIGALEPAQENYTAGYRGQNVYHANKEDGIISSPQTSVPASPDVPIVPKTLTQSSLQTSPSSRVSGTSDIAAGSQGSPLISYVGVNSGPSVRISSGPGIRTISYSAPGGILISHGSPGTSYVLSAHRPAAYFHSYIGGVFENPQMRRSDSTPSSSASATLASSFRNFDPADHRPAPVPTIRHSSGYVRGPDRSSIIGLVSEGPFQSLQATGEDGHSSHFVAYRNLQTAGEIAAGISTTVSRALHNLALIGI